MSFDSGTLHAYLRDALILFFSSRVINVRYSILHDVFLLFHDR